MSGVAYRFVNWNPAKRRYDLVAAGAALLALAAGTLVSALARPDATPETALLRALGATAFILLHLILAIGPLARLDRRWLPLLYNRRHLGVLTALLGTIHGAFALIQFHALGDTDPVLSALTAEGISARGYDLPFQPFGVGALLVLILLAATSHDAWQAVLGPRAWKRLHLGAYLAYALLGVHVAFGALRAEPRPWLAGAVALGAVSLMLLHLLAARADRTRAPAELAGGTGWIDAGPVTGLVEGRGALLRHAGEKYALFLHRGAVFCVSNVCRHQLGPLSEGRIVDGCITCPWHGYQYRPEDGRSPPPYNDRIETFPAKVVEGRVLVDLRPREAR
ncbi:MAG TPA: Rieske 2Fe-2S domain-containing protein [Gemmatimonadales bacterium]|nr:Rieske 2Fe-2S domain-containing protein [Gemmatimonadales bacterium]